MSSITMAQSLFRVFLVTLSVLAILPSAAADIGPSYPVAYCSTLNTATTAANSSTFQSEGLCHDFCLNKNYAFAVLNEKDCWCSDYVPGTTTSTGSCDTPCAGYPYDLCGGNGLYGYVALNKAPLGTEGASTSTTSSTSLAAAAAAATTIVAPTTSAIVATTSTTPEMTSTQSETSATWTATPVTSLYTITGSVHTVTYTPTSQSSSPSTDATDATVEDNHSGLSVGQAVGLTVGLVLLCAVVAGLVFFCIRKRRRAGAAYDNASNRGSSSAGMNGPNRSMSQSSRYMLSTDGKQVVEGWGDDDETTASGTRRSRLMPVDPRLDPFAPVYQRADGSQSRDSVATIRDDHDYSRRVLGAKAVLRTTNPD